jgi:signal transduction histidine kinase
MAVEVEHTTHQTSEAIMVNTIRKVSLRTRLVMLAAFAIVALVVALFVAWRLARATESFALRQADSSIHAAARDLAREFQDYPDGYQTLDQAKAADGPPRPSAKDDDRRARPAPPHVATLFAAYADPLTRLTAITLHRFPEVAGGFYRPAGDTLVASAFSGDSAASANEQPSADVVTVIRKLASQAVATGRPASQTIQAGSDRILVVAYPTQSDDRELPAATNARGANGANDIAAAWAVQRLSHLAGASDRANLAALVALALSILAVSGLALITVRDLRSGVAGIEAGLVELKDDLNGRIPTPRTTELARIASAVNELANTLRANLARQAELEQELRRSERLSALGRVVAGVAHEVRNPLAAIKLKIQLARRADYAPDKLDSTFRVVGEEIDRLDSLVRRLLELGRNQTIERGAVDLCKLVRLRAALFSDLAGRSGVEIVIDAANEEIIIEGDGNRLAQVLDNLMQNALDAMPDGGHLTIACRTVTNGPSPVALLSFEDTGHGIRPADQEHIFEPFHTGRDAGTGLGLAIARAIIDEHGGRISFVSDADSGASFLIELPLPTEKK